MPHFQPNQLGVPSRERQSLHHHPIRDIHRQMERHVGAELLVHVQPPNPVRIAKLEPDLARLGNRQLHRLGSPKVEEGNPVVAVGRPGVDLGPEERILHSRRGEVDERRQLLVADQAITIRVGAAQHPGTHRIAEDAALQLGSLVDLGLRVGGEEHPHVGETSGDALGQVARSGEPAVDRRGPESRHGVRAGHHRDPLRLAARERRGFAALQLDDRHHRQIAEALPLDLAPPRHLVDVPAPTRALPSPGATRLPTSVASRLMERLRRWAPLPWIVTVLCVSNLIRPFVPHGPWGPLVGMWSPALWAIVFSLLERRSLGESLNIHRGRAGAYAIAITVPVIVAAATVVFGLASGHLQLNPNRHLTVGGQLASLVMWLGGVPGEELGWRGYLHLRLRGRRHAALWVGLVWAAWHLRAKAFEVGADPVALGSFILLLLVLSDVLYRLTEWSGSVWPAVLVHALWNVLRNALLVNGRSDSLFVGDRLALTDMEGLVGLFALLLAAAWVRWVLHLRGSAEDTIEPT